jgi:hypothetical protein
MFRLPGNLTIKSCDSDSETHVCPHSCLRDCTQDPPRTNLLLMIANLSKPCELIKKNPFINNDEHLIFVNIPSFSQPLECPYQGLHCFINNFFTMLDSPGSCLLPHQLDSVLILLRNSCLSPPMYSLATKHNLLNNVVLLDLCLNSRVALKCLKNNVQLPHNGKANHP